MPLMIGNKPYFPPKKAAPPARPPPKPPLPPRPPPQRPPAKPPVKKAAPSFLKSVVNNVKAAAAKGVARAKAVVKKATAVQKKGSAAVKKVKDAKGKVDKVTGAFAKAGAKRPKVPAGLKKRAPAGLLGMVGKIKKHVGSIPQSSKVQNLITVHGALKNLQGIKGGLKDTAANARKTWTSIKKGDLKGAVQNGKATLDAAKGVKGSVKQAAADAKALANTKRAQQLRQLAAKQAPKTSAKAGGLLGKLGDLGKKVSAKADALKAAAKKNLVKLAAKGAAKIPGSGAAANAARAGGKKVTQAVVQQTMRRAEAAALKKGVSAGAAKAAARQAGIQVAKKGGIRVLASGAMKFAGPVGVAYTGAEIGWATGNAINKIKIGDKTVLEHNTDAAFKLLHPKLAKQEKELEKQSREDDKHNKYIKDNLKDIQAGKKVDRYSMHVRATAAMVEAGKGDKVWDGDERKKFVKSLQKKDKWPPPVAAKDFKPPPGQPKPPPPPKLIGPPAPKPRPAPPKPAGKKH